MQHDEVIWQVIRHKHCSYMAKIETGIFCRNQYNVTGLCNRSSCPLANSRYATIRDHDGVFYLYMKTIERAHMPKNLWERVKLPRNYEQALEMIDKNMMYWPQLLLHKVKQRLTKMTQMRIRMRKLALKTLEKVGTMPRRNTKREKRREEKALKAAVLDKAIENELLTRLKTGIYPTDIYNYPESLFNEALDKVDVDKEVEEEDKVGETEYVEWDDELEMEEEEDIEDFYGRPSKESHLEGDDQDSEDEDEDGDDDAEEQVVIHKKGRALKKFDDNGKSKKKSRVVVEVDQEDGDTRRTLKSLKL